MDRVAGLALWRQIADQIKGDISKDILRPGCKLPTEILLAQQFKPAHYKAFNRRISGRGIIKS